MLVLARKKDQTVVIDLSKLTANQLAMMQSQGLAKVEVTIKNIRGDSVRLGVDGCKLIPIHRLEIQQRIEGATT
jgi:sRNA-binding carbon storage regulator CsrA